jgi:hypothetical protein
MSPGVIVRAFKRVSDGGNGGGGESVIGVCEWLAERLIAEFGTTMMGGGVSGRSGMSVIWISGRNGLVSTMMFRSGDVGGMILDSDDIGGGGEMLVDAISMGDSWAGIEISVCEAVDVLLDGVSDRGDGGKVN